MASNKQNKGNNQKGNKDEGEKKQYSGCSLQVGYTTKSTGEHHPNVPVVSGWIRSYGEFMKFVAVPPKENPGTKNKDICRMVVKFQVGEFGLPQLTNGFYNRAKKIMTMPDLKLLANTKEGYVCKMTRPLK